MRTVSPGPTGASNETKYHITLDVIDSGDTSTRVFDYSGVGVLRAILVFIAHIPSKKASSGDLQVSSCLATVSVTSPRYFQPRSIALMVAWLTHVFSSPFGN